MLKPLWLTAVKCSRGHEEFSATIRAATEAQALYLAEEARRRWQRRAGTEADTPPAEPLVWSARIIPS